MSTLALRARTATIRGVLQAAIRYCCGDDAYERYIERCAATRQVPLDRGRYFAQQLEERYRRTTRCC